MECFVFLICYSYIVSYSNIWVVVVLYFPIYAKFFWLTNQTLPVSIFWQIANILLDNQYNYIIILAILIWFTRKIHLYLYISYCVTIQHIWNVVGAQQHIITTTLTNGLFSVHPILVYTSFSLLIAVVFFNQDVLIKHLLGIINGAFYYIKIQKRVLYVTLYTSISAIILGSWWANQELGWGGWWSWDNVEMVNLIVNFTILASIHENYSIKVLYHNIPTYTIVWVVTIMCVTRFDLTQSIHTFLTFSENILLEYYIFVFIILLLMTNKGWSTTPKLISTVCFLSIVAYTLLLALYLSMVTTYSTYLTNIYLLVWYIFVLLLFSMNLICLSRNNLFFIFIVLIYTVGFYFIIYCVFLFLNSSKIILLWHSFIFIIFFKFQYMVIMLDFIIEQIIKNNYFVLQEVNSWADWILIFLEQSLQISLINSNDVFYYTSAITKDIYSNNLLEQTVNIWSYTLSNINKFILNHILDNSPIKFIWDNIFDILFYLIYSIFFLRTYFLNVGVDYV